MGLVLTKVYQYTDEKEQVTYNMRDGSKVSASVFRKKYFCTDDSTGVVKCLNYSEFQNLVKCIDADGNIKSKIANARIQEYNNKNIDRISSNVEVFRIDKDGNQTKYEPAVRGLKKESDKSSSTESKSSIKHENSKHDNKSSFKNEMVKHDEKVNTSLDDILMLELRGDMSVRDSMYIFARAFGFYDSVRAEKYISKFFEVNDELVNQNICFDLDEVCIYTDIINEILSFWSLASANEVKCTHNKILKAFKID